MMRALAFLAGALLGLIAIAAVCVVGVIAARRANEAELARRHPACMLEGRT